MAPHHTDFVHIRAASAVSNAARPLSMALSSVPTITLYERELAELDRRRTRLLRRIAALRPPPENPWAQEQMLRQMEN